MKLKKRTVLAGVILAIMAGVGLYAIKEISFTEHEPNQQVQATKQTKETEQTDSKQSDEDAVNEYSN